MKKDNLLIWGVMTGTSCDGLDISAVDYKRESWLPLWGKSFPYPKELKKKVIHLQNPNARITPKDIFLVNRELSLWYSDCVLKILKKINKNEHPDLIACHGQTIAHYPEKKQGSITVQLFDPSFVVNKTGVSVVSHFREGDVAAGGHGAPLANAFHQLIIDGLGLRKDGVSIHNLGGISNFTYFSPTGKMISCDTGPANVWIDAAVEKVTSGKMAFDYNGLLAKKGKIDTKVLIDLFKHPYIKKDIPKTTGRDDFTLDYFFKKTEKLKGIDRVSTATEFTAATICNAYERFVLKKGHPLKTILVSGGGSKNTTLIEWIKIKLPQVDVISIEQTGLDPTFIEAQAFSYLGLRSLLAAPVGGEWTGVRSWAAPGWITPGKNWNQLIDKIIRF